MQLQVGVKALIQNSEGKFLVMPRMKPYAGARDSKEQTLTLILPSIIVYVEFAERVPLFHSMPSPEGRYVQMES